jgi:hypothetical protein
MAHLHPIDRAILIDHFDRAYYLSAQRDIAAAGIDPFEHFVQHGWREGRDPHPGFDVAYYLAANPDVAENGMNPFLHYINFGKREGRLPRRPLHAARRALEACVPLREKARSWAHAADHAPPMTKAALTAALHALPHAAGVVISVSHDDYVQSCGGAQHLVGDEQRAFADGGWRMLHCSPAAPVPMLADLVPAAQCRIRLRLDGQALGVALFEDLLSTARALRDAGGRLELVIHHLMGHAPERLADLAAAAGRRPLVWIHDFFTLCPSYALMRNDVAFCGAPDAASTACLVCGFGPDRPSHQARVADFFTRTRPWVVAPSRPALDFWHARSDLAHAGSDVVPPARLLLQETDWADEPGRPLRIAHLGARLFHKGWQAFIDLAMAFAGDPRFAFYHLGIEEWPPLPGCIRHVPVRVTAGHRDAMIEAVAEHRIDVVVNWALWPETFCFTVHEALAGGAFVIARAAAGNVWPAVQANAPHRGCALQTDAELHDIFASGDIGTLAAAAPRVCGALLTGTNSAGWFGVLAAHG